MTQLAIPYVRFSTPKQERGDSKERQLEVCQQFIEQQGWIAAPPLMDLGLSAYKGDHLHTGALGRFTRQVLDGEIPRGTTLVVEKLDRLSRQGHKAAYRWLEDMTERGIRIAVVDRRRIYDEDTLRDSFVDIIEVMITAKAANDYSRNLSDRVGPAWRRKIEATQQGKLLTRTCPGWLNPVGTGEGVDGTAFTVNEPRAATVRQIYQWSADGYGLAKITRMLGQHRMPSWGRSGEGWSQVHVLRLLEHPSPEGDYIPYYNNRQKENGERVVGYYPRVVPADLVARARAGLKSRKRSGGPKDGRALYGNLFVGLTRCSKCGGKVSMRRGPLFEDGHLKHPGYLSCENNWQGRGCEGLGMFQYLTFERAALSQILHLSMDDKFFLQPKVVVHKTHEVADTQKALQDARDRQASLIAAIEKVADPTPLLGRYDALSGTIRELEAQLATLQRELTVAQGVVPESEMFAVAREMREAIESPDNELRLAARQKVAMAVKAAVESVTFYNEDKERDAKGRTTKTGKRILVTMVGGLHYFAFDDRGNLTMDDGFMAMFDARDRRFDELTDSEETARAEAVSKRMKQTS